MKNLAHSAYALLFMAIIGLLTGNWLAGAMLGIGFYLGREHAQAEYRVIQRYYAGKRANMPWWGAFQRRAWTEDAVMDWLLPTMAVLCVAVTTEILK
jgi:hypothetical protein